MYTSNNSCHLLNVCCVSRMVPGICHMLPLPMFILTLGGTVIISVLELRKQSVEVLYELHKIPQVLGPRWDLNSCKQDCFPLPLLPVSSTHTPSFISEAETMAVDPFNCPPLLLSKCDLRLFRPSGQSGISLQAFMLIFHEF